MKIALAVAVVMMGVSPAAYASVLVDSPGIWTLDHLGTNEFDLPTSEERSSHSVGYRLPAGAMQGPHAWYLIRLHVTVDFAPDSPTGTLYVDGSTNGYAAALITVQPRRMNGRHQVVWSTAGEVGGPVRTVVDGTSAELDFVNYVQNRGVRSGPNSLDFGYEKMGNVRVERIRVHADSGVEVSDRSPAHVAVRAVLPRGTVRENESFRVGYKLRNTGDRPALGVAVRLEASSRALVIGRPAVRRVGRLSGLREGSFRVRAKRAGRYRMTLWADSSNVNDPVIELAVPVGRRSEAAASDRRSWLIGATAILATSGLWLVRRRGRPFRQ